MCHIIESAFKSFYDRSKLIEEYLEGGLVSRESFDDFLRSFSFGLPLVGEFRYIPFPFWFLPMTNFSSNSVYVYAGVEEKHLLGP